MKHCTQQALTWPFFVFFRVVLIGHGPEVNPLAPGKNPFWFARIPLCRGLILFKSYALPVKLCHTVDWPLEAKTDSWTAEEDPLGWTWWPPGTPYGTAGRQLLAGNAFASWKKHLLINGSHRANSRQVLGHRKPDCVCAGFSHQSNVGGEASE